MYVFDNPKLFDGIVFPPVFNLLQRSAATSALSALQLAKLDAWRKLTRPWVAVKVNRREYQVWPHAYGSSQLFPVQANVCIATVLSVFS